jgi:hypothetical protein
VTWRRAVIRWWRATEQAGVDLINLTNAGTWRAPVDALIPVGPLSVRVKLPTILDHEVVVIG